MADSAPNLPQFLIDKVLVVCAMADSAPELTQDLIDRVLILLPAKSVGRFRCVSKLWRSHLSSPEFMKSHRDLNINRGARNIIVPIFEYPLFTGQFPYLLTFAADGTSNKVNYPLFSKHVGWVQATRVLNTCHGFALILLNIGMFVFNPVTLEFLEIPRFQFSEESDKCGTEYGLGYDSSNDDYKVVRLSYFDGFSGREYDGTYVDVYSLKMKSWRRIANSPYHYHYHDLRMSKQVAYSNGRLHWMAFNDDKECVTAAFNLAREEFEEVPFPDKKPFSSLAAFGEYFALDRYNSRGGCYDIWVMKKYGVQESWTKVVIDTRGEYLGKFVCLSGEDETMYIRRFPEDPEHFFAYSLSTGVWRDFSFQGAPVIFMIMKWQ